MKKPVRPQIGGLHHVTAMAGDAKRNLAFYTTVLGQRLIKKTVNFDDPGTYHLYYGDRMGRPGTILTFFPRMDSARGYPGVGAVTETAYAVPKGSLEAWEQRLRKLGVSPSPGHRFGERFLGFRDPDGLSLALIETDNSGKSIYWEGSGLDQAMAIRGFHSVTATVHDSGPTESLLIKQLGYQMVEADDNRRRLETGAGGPSTYFDLLTDPAGPPARPGVGIVHHVAFATPDDESQVEMRGNLVLAKVPVSTVRDRQYFHSIYFNEPGGILFEVATNNPGFVIDEAEEELGTGLKLPPQYEASRSMIEAGLPSLD